ncbi:MAG: DUF3990 domain-containing protein [Verrucomicrobia bacterium]|nr:DUF3990 domain-containing protein [Verrucomicrobiota bacterium]
MILYHGSNKEIDVIDLSLSRPNKDFGKGFYLSSDKEQAVSFAKFKASSNGGDPVITAYSFDETVMDSNELKVKVFTEYSKEWAEFVFANRNSVTGNSVHDYDIVYGPIANDRVGVQVLRYIEHLITLEQFLENLRYMKGITFQYFFGTESAVERLKKL